MIVKDEQEMLPRCLEAVRPAVDEIVIVDTGSTDTTIEIAESFGARVIERDWTGSFADARDASFDAATGDWLLYLDADEVLVAEDVPHLRALTGRVWRESFYLVETNFTGELDYGTAVTHSTLRVFRNLPHYRFEGRIHEQIAHHLPAYLPERIEATTVRMDHYGYFGTVRDAREKSRRNVELLERQVAEGLEPLPALQPRLSEYSAAGNHETSLEHFQRAWESLQEDPEMRSYPYAPRLVARLGQALRVTGHLEQCHCHSEAGLSLFPGFTDLLFERAYAAYRRTSKTPPSRCSSAVWRWATPRATTRRRGAAAATWRCRS